MTFWTSQKLELELPKLVGGFDKNQIDCNAYTLKLGDEVYVSPTDQAADSKANTIQRLGKDEAFTLPPGQFAFLITEEWVRIPEDAMAFISIKAKIKFRGLVNVSGFHVDPGFHGRLVFSVFNAGPSVVHLKRGQDCFLIWFSSLGEKSVKRYKPEFQNATLSTDFINAVPGELQSMEGLNKKIKEVEKSLTEKISRIEPKQAELLTKVSIFLAVVTAILIGSATYYLRQISAASAQATVKAQMMPVGVGAAVSSSPNPASSLIPNTQMVVVTPPLALPRSP